MPGKTRKAAIESLSATGPFATGNPAVLDRSAFKLRFDDLLRRIDKAAPHKNARELEHRIADGEKKIAAAEGKVSEERLNEARKTLEMLKAELTDLHATYIVPHHVLHMINYLLDANGRQSWPITGTGRITIDLPGITSISVEVPTEPPF